jgi:hypothetical protein
MCIEQQMLSDSNAAEVPVQPVALNRVRLSNLGSVEVKRADSIMCDRCRPAYLQTSPLNALLSSQYSDWMTMSASGAIDSKCGRGLARCVTSISCKGRRGQKAVTSIHNRPMSSYDKTSQTPTVQSTEIWLLTTSRAHCSF